MIHQERNEQRDFKTKAPLYPLDCRKTTGCFSALQWPRSWTNLKEYIWWWEWLGSKFLQSPNVLLNSWNLCHWHFDSKMFGYTTQAQTEAYEGSKGGNGSALLHTGLSGLPTYFWEEKEVRNVVPSKGGYLWIFGSTIFFWGGHILDLNRCLKLFRITLHKNNDDF